MTMTMMGSTTIIIIIILLHTFALSVPQIRPWAESGWGGSSTEYGMLQLAWREQRLT